MFKRILALTIVVILAFHGFVFANSDEKNINGECAVLIIDTILDDNYVFFDKNGNEISKDLRELLETAALENNIDDCISLLANAVAFAEKKLDDKDSRANTEWVTVERTGFEYLTELLHNYPNHNMLVYRVNLKYELNLITNRIVAVLPPVMLEYYLSYMYGNNPPVIQISNKTASIRADMLAGIYKFTMDASIYVEGYDTFYSNLCYQYHKTVTMVETL